ncbi:MAG: ABC transporter ATP-binding protein [Clostridia bacterium]|nr:ABC transporter ATP-binding protein [Clostridia bacterium]
MKKIFSYFSAYKKECFLAPLLKLAEALMELFIPILVADIIDRGINGASSSVIITDVLIMIGLGALGLTFSVCGQYFSAKAAVGYSSDLRSALYKKIVGLPLAKTDEVGTSRMITAMTSDIGKVQSGVNLALRLLLRSPFVVIGAFIAALIINVKIALIFGVTILMLALTVAVIMMLTMPKFSKSQGMLDGATLVARENLTGVRVIRAFGVEDAEIEDYRKRINALEKFQNSTGKISSLLNPLTFCMVNLAIVALLYFGGVKVSLGILTQGAIIALYDYLSQILIELVKFANLVVSISKAIASGKRISKTLEIEEEENSPKEDESSQPFIRFKNVCASYGGGEVLTDINVSVEKGQTVGIIGGTGSGKSTLVNLLAGLYTAKSGAVYVDGRDISGFSDSEKRRYVAIALQRPVLFKGTVKSNLLMGRQGATDEEMLQAVRIAQADDVLMAKEKGLDSSVEQGGRNFSGGQRQRLSLARAIVAKPEILVLDDSSSALDYVTDLNLRRALKNQDLNQTLIIVSQRTASVKDADKIIVLEDGEIVGVGTHGELYETCETYREIEDSQSKGGGV